jgi:polyferredoxin
MRSATPARPRRWIRRLVQLGMAAGIGEFAFYGVFRCPFAVPYVSCGSCPVVQCPGRQLWIPVWVGILASGLLVGRAFCGWACPVGLVADLLGKVSLLRHRLRGRLDRGVAWGKILVLLASVAVVIVLANPRWAIPIRTGGFFQSVALTVEHASPAWLWRTGFIAGAILLGLVVSHLWCRTLCATGGLLDLLNRVAPWRYHRTAACNDCDQCREVCPVDTRPAEHNCTSCGVCDHVCPTDAIRFRRGRSSA